VLQDSVVLADGSGICNQSCHGFLISSYPFAVNCCRVKSVNLLSHRIESLENLWSQLFSGGSFSNTPSKCSVKFPRGDKLFSESIGVVDLSLAPFRVSSVDPSSLPKADSLSIANQSWAC
jgi:hypothetical protein